jgi:hypothetical protein
MSERVLVVYESMFGNTERIARAVGDGLRVHRVADVVAVSEAPATVPGDVGLIVVGGPTHAFSMSRRSTRDDARKQGTVVMPVEVGIRDWLDVLGRAGARPVRAATFDTRITKVRRLPGSAARSAARRLRRAGFRLLCPPESFFVDDTTGPLPEAELERAREWGERLGQLLAGSSVGGRR